VFINTKRIHRARIPKYKSELKLREGKCKMEETGNVSVNNPPHNTKMMLHVQKHGRNLG
jgi:hypothetical protein